EDVFPRGQVVQPQIHEEEVWLANQLPSLGAVQEVREQRDAKCVRITALGYVRRERQEGLIGVRMDIGLHGPRPLLGPRPMSIRSRKARTVSREGGRRPRNLRGGRSRSG